ncbi:MAG TPA: ABC transporter permease [Firmicutes bacterium]|nr:ABC transporter permease [Bacillota bacterium]
MNCSKAAAEKKNTFRHFLTREKTEPLLTMLSSLIISFCIIAALLLLTGYNPVFVFSTLFTGAFVGEVNISETLLSATPLMLLGLAVAFSFKASLLNIGVEGQMIVGALAAGAVGIYLKNMPAFLHVTLSLSAGMAAGALWAFLPGYLKAKRGSHEVIITVMMNYISFRVSAYLLNGPLKAPGANIAASPRILPTARLPILITGTRLSIGILFALLTAAILWYMFRYTKYGYGVEAVGLNAHAAEYSGIKIDRTIITSMLISGAIAGLAGGVEILGLHYRVYDQFSPGYGFESIAVALVGGGSPLGVVLSGLLFGALKAGSVNMQTVAGTSKDLVKIIQAIIIFFAVAGFSFKNLLAGLRRKFKAQEAVLPGGE